MFFIVALTVFLLMHGYVGWRIIPSLNLSPISNYIAYAITFILGFLPLLPIILRINGYESKIIDDKMIKKRIMNVDIAHLRQG